VLRGEKARTIALPDLQPESCAAEPNGGGLVFSPNLKYPPVCTNLELKSSSGSRRLAQIERPIPHRDEVMQSYAVQTHEIGAVVV
jgi:hypothetical protein